MESPCRVRALDENSLSAASVTHSVSKVAWLSNRTKYQTELGAASDAGRNSLLGESGRNIAALPAGKKHGLGGHLQEFGSNVTFFFNEDQQFLFLLGLRRELFHGFATP